MFAYCLNDPINFFDPDGQKRLWFHLAVNHDWGYIHRAVQAHILAVNNVGAMLFDSEYVIPGVGRADIIKPETNEVWEIKHGGNSLSMQDQRTNEALAQISRYTNDTGLCAGQANAFSGCFVINCNDGSYLISYNTPENGVILYYVTPLKNPDPEPYLVYVPQTARVPSSVTSEFNLAYLLLPGLMFNLPGSASTLVFQDCYAY